MFEKSKSSRPQRPPQPFRKAYDEKAANALPKQRNGQQQQHILRKRCTMTPTATKTISYIQTTNMSDLRCSALGKWLSVAGNRKVSGRQSGNGSPATGVLGCSRFRRIVSGCARVDKGVSPQHCGNSLCHMAGAHAHAHAQCNYGQTTKLQRKNNRKTNSNN